MGWTFSNGVTFQHQGQPANVHADGNNVAWVCPKCSHPLLFTYQNGRAGSDPASPTICPGCTHSYSLHPPYGTSPEPPKGQYQAPAVVMQFV